MTNASRDNVNSVELGLSQNEVRVVWLFDIHSDEQAKGPNWWGGTTGWSSFRSRTASECFEPRPNWPIHRFPLALLQADIATRLHVDQVIATWMQVTNAGKCGDGHRAKLVLWRNRRRLHRRTVNLVEQNE